MARYNKISRNLWTEGGMVDLPPLSFSPTALYLYLRTCDRPTRIAGLLRGAATIADDTGWPLEGVREGVLDLSRRGLVVVSDRPAYIFVPEALSGDLPDKGNALKGALDEVAELPDCLPTRAAKAVLQGQPLPEGVTEGVREGVPKGLSTQEQEQEQEQEQLLLSNPATAVSDPLFAFIASSWPNRLGNPSTLQKWIDTARAAHPKVDLLVEARKCAVWWMANPTKVANRKNVRGTLTTWWGNASKEMKSKQSRSEDPRMAELKRRFNR